MPKYYVLYKTKSNNVYQTHYFANAESEARTQFMVERPQDELLLVRKGEPFKKADIKKQKDKLKYA